MKGSNDIFSNLMQNRTTAEFVFERIKREIITGALRPGQRLVERDLTERFEVSRTPVREALKQLERSQLVVNIPYRGVEVRRISFEFARDVYDLRLGIEGIASYLAAQRATSAELVRLEHIFNTIDELTTQGQRDEVMMLNNAFHKAVAEATHNQLLISQVDDLWTTINSVRASAWRGTTRTEGSRLEHGKMLRAIVSRDAEAARHATEAHVRNSWKVVEEALQREQDAGTDEVLSAAEGESA